MKDILFLCSGGFSSSMVVDRMKKIAQERKINVEIFWGSAGVLLDRHNSNTYCDEGMNFQNAGVILLTPHLRPYLEIIRKNAPQNVPLHIMDGRLYGDIEGLFDIALNLMAKGNEESYD